MKELEIKSFLNTQDIEYTENGTQIITSCPVCKYEGKTYIGKDNGVWTCFHGKCSTNGESMPFSKYKESVTGEKNKDSYYDLKDYPDVIMYLNERKFSKTAIDYIGIKVDKNGNPAFPEDDIFTGYTRRYFMRNVNDVKVGDGIPKYYGFGQKGVINGRILLNTPKKIIICEGHPDLVALLSYDFRFKDVAISFGGTNDVNKDALEIIQKADEVYIVYDTDAPGVEGASRLAEKIGLDKAKIVTLPCNDINDCLTSGVTKEDFLALFDEADKVELKGSSTSATFRDATLKYIFQEGEWSGKESKFKNLDTLMDGWRMGELTLLSGLTSVGKTTFSKVLMHNFAIQGFGSLIVSFETKTTKLLKDLLHLRIGGNPKEAGEDRIIQELDLLDVLPLRWYDQKTYEGSLGLEGIVEYIKNHVSLYGTKFFLLDDLDYIVTNTEFPRAYLEKEKNVMVTLVSLSRELNIHILLVAHIKKVEDETKMPSKMDIKGAAEISNKSDNIIIVHRDTLTADEELKELVTLYVAKVRDDGDTGYVEMKYSKDRCRYEEL